VEPALDLADIDSEVPLEPWLMPNVFHLIWSVLLLILLLSILQLLLKMLVGFSTAQGGRLLRSTVSDLLKHN
jgi:hypothetical protein